MYFDEKSNCVWKCLYCLNNKNVSNHAYCVRTIYFLYSPTFIYIYFYANSRIVGIMYVIKYIVTDCKFNSYRGAEFRRGGTFLMNQRYNNIVLLKSLCLILHRADKYLLT